MQCIICLEKIDRLKIHTSCAHTYHKSCLDKWFNISKSKNCPICRREIQYTVVKRYNTRSKTLQRRFKRFLTRFEYLGELLELTYVETEKREVINKMLQEIYKNKDIMKKCIKYQHNHTIQSILQNVIDNVKDEKMRTLFICWKIKFDD